ncbi:MAG: heparinase II/III family protein [Paludibacter sp.]|nr:heparinase II/III family protein [Paludibacter sp.]
MSVNASVERNMLSTGRSATMLSELLLTSGDWVPYPSYSNRAGWDVLLGDRKANLVKNGESRLDYTWKVIPATAYLEYERSGNRNIMQDPNSDNNEALADLLMAELAEGKGRFLDQIINGVFYNCERTSWVLSAHLPLQLSTRTLPDHTDSVIDLGSGELGAMLAWTYFFFNREFDRVNPIISKRLYKELYDKIIIPYRTIDRYWWMAFVPREDGMVNNWNPWTNFNCLQVIALLENDKVQMGKDVYRSMVSVDKFINYVNFDGACEEGPSYWSHAAGKLYDYLELVKMITNGQVNLFGEQIIRNMGEYISRSYIGNGWVVNFADASAQFSTSGGLVYRYGKAVNSKEMMQFGAYLDQRNQSLIPSGTDLFRTLESLRYYDELMATNAVHRPAPVTTYPETQFYYFSDEATGFLAVKGGYNAESHNHNDAGTFSLWVDKLPLFIDAGVGTYTRQTFGPERYTIWTMRSAFHNLPSINGKEQVFGKQYKATSIKVNESKKSVSMELAGAYPAETSVKSWNRGYQLSKGKLVITDKFLLNEWKAPHQLHFMVWGHIEQKPGKISIHTKDKKAQLLYDAGNYDYQLETIELTDPRLSRVWGNEIYRITLTNKSKKRQSTSHITILY